mmetsp:Transcript_8974/g.15186  ORF Transcript_8974/g.15186 Transcript_8974/m.15186 type:complete len:128 (-) Transcript_8974:188-571(-)
MASVNLPYLREINEAYLQRSKTEGENMAKENQGILSVCQVNKKIMTYLVNGDLIDHQQKLTEMRELRRKKELRQIKRREGNREFLKLAMSIRVTSKEDIFHLRSIVNNQLNYRSRTFSRAQRMLNRQ